MCVCVCGCGLVSACLHLSSPSAPSLCPAECHILGTKMKTRCSLIKKKNKPSSTMRYRSQITKHATGVIFYFNYDEIHIKFNHFKCIVCCSGHSHFCATKLENFFFFLVKLKYLPIKQTTPHFPSLSPWRPPSYFLSSWI